MDAILKRRSIRKYTKQPIPDKIIKELLEAAVSAPSAGNQQPWHFIIIDDRKIFNEIPKFHSRAKMLKDADKAILVCGDLSLEKFKGYWILDCSAATENILITAHAKGLGACWLGIYPREERIVGMKKLLRSIPEHVVPLSLISLGFPAEQKTSEDRYNSSRIHHNKW
ncbi:MAG: nitroreductase family protein [Thermoplasmatales archaeon]|nr:nitroreductase family protein [Thermoplasmatales archaeon]